MEPAYVIVRNVVVSILRLLFRWRFIGLDKIPKRGPIIIAPNHISNFDPLGMGLMVDHAGRRPRFLAKASLWKVPVLGWLFSNAKQIPVERGSGHREPFDAAVRALKRGECIVLYPEGTITKNPDLTPMQGKKGIARMALQSGAAVVPVGQWGLQWYIAKYHKSSWRPFRTVMYNIGDPMTFEDVPPEMHHDDATLRDVTDRIMAEIDRLVRELHKIHPEGAAIPPLKEPKGQPHG